MKEWHIWDFPSNLYALIGEKVRIKFFETMYQKFGSQSNYASFLGKDRNSVQKYHYARSWDHGRKHVAFMPLKVLQKSRDEINNELRIEIENSVQEIRAHGGKSINGPILPIKESPALYRIVAHILADGNDSHTPYYANTCKELREHFKRDLQTFGKVFYMENIPNTTPCVNFPKVITRILSHVLDVQFTHPNRIPEDVFSSSEDCKSAFIAALFDDDGSTSNGIVLTIHNYNLINQVKKLLVTMDINTNKIGRITLPKKDKIYLQINSKSVPLFHEKVKLIHPSKKHNISKMIEIKSRKQRTRKKIVIDHQIITMLEYNSRTTKEIANELLFTLNGLYTHLRRLENEGIITRKGEKNKVLWDLA